MGVLQQSLRKVWISMKIDAQGIAPEIVAVITAAIYQMMGCTSFQAVKISRDSDGWISAGRKNA